MNTYKVELKEINSRTFKIEASSRGEAENKALEMYGDKNVEWKDVKGNILAAGFTTIIAKAKNDVQ